MDEKKILEGKIEEYLQKYAELEDANLNSKLKTLISKSLQYYRMKNRLTQDKLANELEISRMQLFRWEAGLCKPHPNTIKKLQDKGILPNLD